MPSPITTDSWRPALDAYEPSLVKAAEHAARFVADVRAGALLGAASRSIWPGNARWLTLIGVCGSGKTMLARQIFRAAEASNPGNMPLWSLGTGVRHERDRRPRCVWLTATEFADRMLGGEWDLPEHLAADFLVAIDDVGAARDTKANHIAEALYRLCNVRLGKWTLFTSNLNLSDIAAKIDERVASRLIRDGNVVHRITAGDYAMPRKR
jgi:DNA replication protein DnaC